MGEVSQIMSEGARADVSAGSSCECCLPAAERARAERTRVRRCWGKKRGTPRARWVCPLPVMRMTQQAKKRFVPIIGYGYGKKHPSNCGLPKFYVELAGKAFWTELTGDETFYIKLIRFMDKLPKQ